MRTTSASGAYGLRLDSIGASASMLVGVPEEWPELHVRAGVGDASHGAESITAEHAALNLKTGGRLTVDRHVGVASYTTPRPIGPDELVHPFLAPAAAVAAHWGGRLSFHAGGFVAGGTVWAVVGDREAGKSSALAWLAVHGHDVAADDVLVLGDGDAFTGPRTVDLREGTAERFGIGADVGVLGARRRWRVDLAPMAPVLPFGGWVFLRWGEAVGARALGPSQLLPLLAEHLTLRVPPADGQALLDLAALPAWELTRPKDWDALDDAMAALLALPSA